jgi:hypothetical protein
MDAVVSMCSGKARLTRAKKKPIWPPWFPDLVRIARARQPATKVKRAWAAWKRAFDFWK